MAVLQTCDTENGCSPDHATVDCDAVLLSTRTLRRSDCVDLDGRLRWRGRRRWGWQQLRVRGAVSGRRVPAKEHVRQQVRHPPWDRRGNRTALPGRYAYRREQ